MSIKTFIFSQPDKPIVKEKKEIDQTYKKFRIEIIASVFISYAVFYLTRKNFSAAMPAMLDGNVADRRRLRHYVFYFFTFFMAR
ncbi:regulatory protein UhpC [Salmonella enterica subsp. enterica]|uniref:Regulatory protein UhpC n=1 Tax=Salmonella enterica I TaxID=59201 RepID=A0A447TZV8_SALET|nr:regulatory protein UhpC [Salmonella enterica subsp. enterica]